MFGTRGMSKAKYNEPTSVRKLNTGFFVIIVLMTYGCQMIIILSPAWWTCNFPMTLHARRLVGRSVCLNFLWGRAVTLLCSYWSTCIWMCAIISLVGKQSEMSKYFPLLMHFLTFLSISLLHRACTCHGRIQLLEILLKNFHVRL